MDGEQSVGDAEGALGEHSRLPRVSLSDVHGHGSIFERPSPYSRQLTSWKRLRRVEVYGEVFC